MLVLSFREGKTLMIGDTIQVRVTAIFENRICVAIRRPHDILICSRRDREKLSRCLTWTPAREALLAAAQRMLDPKGGEVPVVLAENIQMLIGPDIEITVTEILYGQGKVRIGIEAPKDIPVHRLKIYESIKAEVRAAATKD